LFSLYKNVFLVFIENTHTFIEVIYPVLIILVACLTSFITERIFVWIDTNKNGFKRISPFNSIIPGLYLAMLLPINTPIYIVLIGALLATLFGKMLYGGFGENLFNPTAIGYIFIVILFGSILTNPDSYFNLVEKGKYISLPLSNLSTFSYDKIVAPFGSLYNFIFGTVPGPLGTTNAFLMILSFALLSIFKVIKWKITLTFLLTVFIMTLIIGLNHDAGIWFPIFNILSGSLLFSGIYVRSSYNCNNKYWSNIKRDRIRYSYCWY
jgi:Na+-translocating ferredoxin:NAD+ oxidoreductase RnfD subunit